MTTKELTKLVKQIAKEVDSIGPGATLLKAIQPLYDAGITPNMHVGVDSDKFNNRMKVEWLGGSVLDIVENQAWFAMNSWINMVSILEEEG